MKEALMQILACPRCGNHPLQLKNAHIQSNEVEEGMLSCLKCASNFNIIDKIPRFISSNTDESITENQCCDSCNNSFHHKIREANIKYYNTIGDFFEQDINHSVYLKVYNQVRIDSIIRELAYMTEGQHYLDLGCGTGNLLKYGKMYFKNAIGVDISLNLLRQASNRGLDVIQSDIISLPFKAKTFNAISIFSVLHHIYDYPEVIKISGKLLKSCGYLYTDWDPQQSIKSKSALVKTIYFAFFLLRKFKIINEVDDDINKDQDISVDNSFSDIRKNEPWLRKIVELAEYHEKSKERGLNPDLIKSVLNEAGFSSVNITGHWQGKTFEQLNLSRMNKLEFAWLSKASGYPVDRFMENIKVIAKKA